jgi:hypothetical protein
MWGYIRSEVKRLSNGCADVKRLFQEVERDWLFILNEVISHWVDSLKSRPIAHFANKTKRQAQHPETDCQVYFIVKGPPMAALDVDFDFDSEIQFAAPETVALAEGMAPAIVPVLHTAALVQASVAEPSPSSDPCYYSAGDSYIAPHISSTHMPQNRDRLP